MHIARTPRHGRPVKGPVSQHKPIAVRAVAAPTAPRAPQQASTKERAVQGPKTVDANIRYVNPPPPGEQLYTYLYDLPEGVSEPTNVGYEDHQMTVTDLRQVEQPMSLQRNGFQLVQWPNGDPVEGLDWGDEEQVKARFYPEVKEMLKRVTGATRVEIFDHTLRKGAIGEDAWQPGKLQPPGEPVQRAHVDYTVNSGPKRMHDVAGEEWDQLSRTPYAVVQVWRPLNGPVQSAPLGMADASTVAPGDLLPSALHFPGRTGEIYVAAHNPQHQWYYARGIRNDEMYVFVCYDSRTDGRARFTPHTAFADPTTPAGAPPRQSCETRCYVFWEDASTDASGAPRS